MSDRPREDRRPDYVPDDPVFRRIAKAADQAAAEVLEEDRLLRELGIEPEHGRSK